MYSLVITIIAISLAVALALATIYYGGRSFIKSNADAVVATTLNTGQQLAGAFYVNRSDAPGANITINGLLSSNYLTSIPSVNSIKWREVHENDGWLLLPNALNQEACLRFNIKTQKLDGVPSTPVAGVSMLCFGTQSQGYSVIWKMIGSQTLPNAVSNALSSSGKDSAGDPLNPSSITPVSPIDIKWDKIPTALLPSNPTTSPTNEENTNNTNNSDTAGSTNSNNSGNEGNYVFKDSSEFWVIYNEAQRNKPVKTTQGTRLVLIQYGTGAVLGYKFMKYWYPEYALTNEVPPKLSQDVNKLCQEHGLIQRNIYSCIYSYELDWIAYPVIHEEWQVPE